MEKVETEKKTTIVTCEGCNQDTKYCTKLHDAGLSLCVRTVNCNKVEYVAQRICEFLGYKFLRIERKNDVTIVHFICDNGHEWYLNFTTLRTGAKCIKCTHENQIKSKLEKETRVNCDCKNNRGIRPKICPHYNHAVCYPDSIQHWSVENTINPTEIAPKSHTECKWDCPRCGKVFPQTPKARATKQTYFCSLICKIEPDNLLSVKYPKICELIDDSETVDLTQISCGSNYKLKLYCNKHDPPYKWECKVKKIVLRFNEYEGDGTPGCEQCNSVGFNQKYGGKEWFVKESNIKHNNEYDYPGDYQGNDTKTAIFCRKLYHGIFYQTPHSHKAGAGCWRCVAEQKESKACQKLRAILDKLGIKYKCEKKFDGMKYINCLRIDFYDKVLRIAFEYDGKQHFYVTSWGGEEALDENRIRDVHKDLYCLQNGIHMYRFCRIEDITEEKIIEIRNMCQSGNQVYASYPDYIDAVSQIMDISKFNVITIQPLTKQ